VLHELLQEAAAALPDHPAVVDGERTLRYGELERDANRVAHLLIGLGAGRGARVGLWFDKSLEAVVALYGVLKTGAAYVPLDPQAPPARLERQARDAGLHCLLISGGRRPEWPVGDARVVDVRMATGCPDAPPGARATELDPAYVLYTSGSTGRPKGVVLTHRNAMAFVAWAAGTFALRPDDRLSSAAPLHFDLSVFDVFAAAAAAATVVMVPLSALVLPRQLRDLVERSGITVWYSVPSLLTRLALHGGLRPGDLRTVRAVLFAGEVFPSRHLSRLMRLLPAARFANLYGPTETNVCTWHEVREPPEEGAVLPIGRPIDGVRVLAVTGDGRRAEPGEVGELHVAGPTVMLGYWRDPLATAAALAPSPGGGVTYRTGDLGVEQPDGSFLLRGRRDAQVKSRGYRIELGEIESVLDAHEAVVECAAVAVPDDLITNRIRAVVVAARPLEAAELAGWCAARLPRYMVPDSFDCVAALPRMSTGKVDRQRLGGDG
jgi:amino acid adenylation domain-containing protein